MHTAPFVLDIVLRESVLVLDRLSSSTSMNARQIELTISGSFQAAARLSVCSELLGVDTAVFRNAWFFNVLEQSRDDFVRCHSLCLCLKIGAQAMA